MSKALWKSQQENGSRAGRSIRCEDKVGKTEQSERNKEEPIRRSLWKSKLSVTQEKGKSVGDRHRKGGESHSKGTENTFK